MKLPGEKWLPILIQSGYCRNVKHDWTCQQIFFWHLVGIIRSVKNRTDTSNWHSSIFSPVLIGNYNSYFHRHVTITIQYLLGGLQSAPCITVDSTSEIFLGSFHSWCSILRWYLTWCIMVNIEINNNKTYIVGWFSAISCTFGLWTNFYSFGSDNKNNKINCEYYMWKLLGNSCDRCIATSIVCML